MYQAQISTPLGKMIAIGDDNYLYHLDFADQHQTKWKAPFGRSRTIDSAEKELTHYFEGKLKEFKTYLFYSGTSFQQKVWKALKDIPYGKTCSYLELAEAVGSPKAYRAVGSANGANSFPILIPCHRVINSNGCLGGYNCGLERKRWLLNFESKVL